MKWVLVAWIFFSDGGWMGTGWVEMDTLAQCQQLFNERSLTFVQDVEHDYLSTSDGAPNAGWMKCVQADTTDEAMDKVRP